MMQWRMRQAINNSYVQCREHSIYDEEFTAKHNVGFHRGEA